MPFHQSLVLVVMSVFSLLSWMGSASAQEVSHQLVFTNGDIYTVDTDSDLATQLTNTPAYEANPTWSPDGTQIAYIGMLSGGYYGQYGLYVMDADGSHVIQLAADLVWRSEPIWTKDGAALIYATSGRADGGDCVLNRVQRDGSERQELFRKPRKTCDVPSLNPALSPDNTRLIFSLDDQTEDKYFQLYMLSLADGQLTKLTDNRASNVALEWSPDGTRIAYTTDQDKQSEVYVMNADGSNPRRLTHRPGYDYAPHWLPDGSQIIFGSDQDGYNVLSVELNKGVVHDLTDSVDSGAWNAALSPDGTQIAYVTGVDPVSGPDHIQIMNLSSGAVHELPNVGSGAFGLQWKPK